jgi:hypothetical protein
VQLTLDPEAVQSVRTDSEELSISIRVLPVNTNLFSVGRSTSTREGDSPEIRKLNQRTSRLIILHNPLCIILTQIRFRIRASKGMHDGLAGGFVGDGRCTYCFACCFDGDGDGVTGCETNVVDIVVSVVGIPFILSVVGD